MAARVPMAPGDFVLPDHVFRELRLAFLQTVARLVPDAMATVQVIPPGDDAALHTWAARWRLGDAWIIDTARRHLAHWRDYPDMAGRWWMVTTCGWVPMPPAVIPEPWKETKAAFLARAEAEWDAAVAAAGATPTPRKQPDATRRHLEWLVRYHVAGETQQAIAESGDASTWVTTGRVSQVVTEMAGLIGLLSRY